MRSDCARNIRKAPPVFDGMAAEEDTHRRRLIEAYRRRFGETIPLIRREHVSGFYQRRPYWLVGNLGIERVREEVGLMEEEARSFYLKAAQRTTRRGDAQAARRPRGRGRRARRDGGAAGDGASCRKDARAEEDAVAHRQFVLTYVQPGLAGLMDGSVSTLAPVFAAAFATHDPWQTFLVGLAASIGAGISMGFTEALSDDGALTGRGSPLKRGLACGVMTTIGGLGHALPYLIPHFCDCDGDRGARGHRRASGRSPGSAGATWRRRSCARASRSCSAARWSSPPEY